jgi:hypothetical protein
MTSPLTRRKDIPAIRSVDRPLRIRSAGSGDGLAIARLAALDSSHAPQGHVLLAEVGDELWAALSLDDGHAIADPLRPSADAILLLAQRARQLRRTRRSSRGFGFPRLRAA